MEGTMVKIRSDVITEEALVITCFPSVGMVSSVVGHFLIDNLDLELVGGVVDPRLPPLTLVTDGKPMPIIRAYAGKPECSIDGCDKIILIMSELVIPSPLVHDIVWALYDWSKGSKIRMGILIDAFSKEDLVPDTSAQCELAPLIGQTRLRDYAFLAAAAPGLVIGVTQLKGADVFEIYGPLVPIVGLVGTAIGLFVWAASSVTAMTNQHDSPLTRMAEETAFISVWVIGAYLAYDYIVEFGGLDLEAMFSTVAPLLPLMDVLIGLVPGCGPQVLVTTMYINGLIPFAALMGNAISNDGDALFPAIALNPKAAIWATLYSTIPAMLAAYGFYFFAPGFMN